MAFAQVTVAAPDETDALLIVQAPADVKVLESAIVSAPLVDSIVRSPLVVTTTFASTEAVLDVDFSSRLPPVAVHVVDTVTVSAPLPAVTDAVFDITVCAVTDRAPDAAKV